MRLLFRYPVKLTLSTAETQDDPVGKTATPRGRRVAVTAPVSGLTLVLLALGFVYSLLVSWLAYRESGKRWMLFLPHWIDTASGISKNLRRHGFAAFGLLFVATAMLIFESG